MSLQNSFHIHFTVVGENSGRMSTKKKQEMLELEEAILWEGRDGYGADLMQGPLPSAIGSLFSNQ